MRSNSAVLLSIRVAVLSRTSAVRETVCLCKQLSFIDLCCSVIQAERWFCSACVALPCLCWWWDEVHVKTSSVSTTFQSISLGSDRDVWPQEAQHVIPLCVFQVWAWVKRCLITEWPLHRWQITREPTAFSRHPLRCCPGASCLPHPETPPEVSQSSWCMNSDLQLRMINQLRSEMVHEVIAEQSAEHSHALWVVERHFGK